MKPDAIAIANYFVEKAKEEGNTLTILPLVKLVYIAHGFLLALMDKSFLNPRFDKVEAWKYGPVIPSVYHSFKHNKSNPITECESALCLDGDKISFITPVIEDPSAKLVLNYVWSSYGYRSANELVTITHKPNSPWDRYYRPNMNIEIPDEATKFYYKKLVEELR